jgi:hypothetical protein
MAGPGRSASSSHRRPVPQTQMKVADEVWTCKGNLHMRLHRYAAGSRHRASAWRASLTFGPRQVNLHPIHGDGTQQAGSSGQHFDWLVRLELVEVAKIDIASRYMRRRWSQPALCAAARRRVLRSRPTALSAFAMSRGAKKSRAPSRTAPGLSRSTSVRRVRRRRCPALRPVCRVPVLRPYFMFSLGRRRSGFHARRREPAKGDRFPWSPP